MLRRKPLNRTRKEWERIPREERIPMALSTLQPVARGTYAGGVSGAAIEKENPVRSEKLRQSAKGEDCLVRIPGCPFDPAQTIWSHYRGSAGGKGGSIKATDIAGAYACTYCDAVYDGQTPRPEGMTKADVDLAWLEGHVRSLVRLQQKGLLHG
jgi:hypothetical protein